MAVRRTARPAAPHPLLFVVILAALGGALWWRLGTSEAPAAAVARTPAPVFLSVPGANTPSPRARIGLVAGHNAVKSLPGGDAARDPSTPLDKGGFCPDNPAIEADLTLDIARRAAALLRADRTEVDILGEFDPRLNGYYGAALVALHVDNCARGLSGYKTVRWTNSPIAATSDRLVRCLMEKYSAATGLAEHRNTITRDMTDYHAFREIAQTTPAAILEMGFIRDDLALLQTGDAPARGVADGIRCFLAR